MWSQSNIIRWNNKNLTANVVDNSAINNDAITVHSSTGGASITDPNWGAFVVSMPHSSDVNLSNYVQFTVDPKAKYKIEADRFQFQYKAQGNTVKFQVRASKDVNFNNYFVISDELVANTSWSSFDKSLTSTGVVKPGEVLYIRVYIYGNNDNLHFKYTSGSSVTNGDGPTITGTYDKLDKGNPIAADDTFSTIVNNSTVLDVVNNDSYSELNQITIVGNPTHGTVSVDSNNLVTYNPYLDYQGTDTFTYKLINSKGKSNVATVTLNITQDASNNVLVRWKDSSYKSTAYNSNIEGFDLSASNGVTMFNEPQWINGIQFNTFKFTGFPIISDYNGNVDASKYIQLGFKIKDGQQVAAFLKKLMLDFNANGTGKLEIKYSKHSDFSSDVYSFSLPNNVATFASTAYNSWISIDQSFENNFILYPNESLYVRIYIYNTSNAGVPVFLKFNTYPEMGPAITGSASLYSPAPCSVSAVWNVTGWVNNVKPDINKKAIINADYDTSVNGSFEACSVQVNKGKLSISKDKYVKVSKTIETTNGGSIEVQSDGNLLQVDDSIVNTSSITVLREAKLKRLDYNYWGSPVDGQNLKAFSPNTVDSKFFVYNERNDYFDGVFSYYKYTGFDAALAFPLQNSASYTFEKGKGYCIRASNYASATPTTYTSTFKGIPNNGQIKVKISRYGNGYNLVGNPYPSNIDMKKLAANNSGLIEELAYFWTNFNPTPQAQQGSAYPANGAVNNYATYNGSGGTLPLRSAADAKSPTQYIKVGQGFIVKVKDNVAAGEYDLKFDNSVRNADGASTFYNVAARTASKQEQAVDRFWLELETPLGLASQMLIAYKKEATNDFEWSYDAPAMIEGSDAIYSILGNQKLVIEGRKYPLVSSDVVPLGASFDGAGTHTISLGDKEGIFANGQNVYLKDKITGITTNLSETSYSFTASAGQDTSRFEIVYVNPSSTLATDANAKKQLLVYQSEGYVNIDSPENMNKVFMFDATGKLVYQNNVFGKSAKINASQFTSGVYMVNIETVNGKQTKKILIK
jgi:hypothetical protein